ncbi:MAG: aminotransferase class I/II-fold pyridoxal phosphate-dependent enzyme [Spirochaetaceae bacterium]|jgi:aspartate/methionine/tyrosine aminotransferase|nr:aminotransferase class I/II-fold pyridoxal phosphate-dependent enzyme [Spirochaetaceae bacterium]
MNYLVEELNSLLADTVSGRLLSPLGRRLYFPKGIIAQSAEAKQGAYTANATIGMAYDQGKPLSLSVIREQIPQLKAEEALVYAPTAGIPEARTVWQDRILRHNPSLKPEQMSLPVVVPGLTAGISYMADLFLGAGDSILLSSPCWDNYELIFQDRRGAEPRAVPFFDDAGGLDMQAFKNALEEAAKTGTVRLILNFPNNPSGYAPTNAEADTLLACIQAVAQKGADTLVLCDDAYFGLFYEADCIKESLFSRLARAHERILAVKIDGPTKEDYVWGFRVGFVTFGSLGLREGHYEGLVKKLMGAIRSSVSCSNTPAQCLMLKTLRDERTRSEKEQYFTLLQRRYRRVKQFLSEHPAHPHLRPLPFNAGYFMSFRCIGISAEVLRRELLTRHGVGAVSFGEDYLRVAFSSIDEEQIPGVYQVIYDTARVLGS